MALVQAELTDGTDAITIRRRDPGPWRRYLAVINCRGQHYYRRFFSKWHELTHRLVDGELDELERLLGQPDQDILEWIASATTTPPSGMRRIVALIRSHALGRP